MSEAVFKDIKLEDIPVDDIDFSDLENEYKLDDEFNFDQYIVVNGTPIIPESKVPVLQRVLTNLFTKAGKVVNMEFPIDEATKKSKGFIFVECGSIDDGKKIIKAFHGKRLDANHRLFIYTMKDVERYNSDSFETEFKEPELPEFVPSSSLKSWLLDENLKDQYVLQDDKTTTVFWNSNFEDTNVVESRDNWSSNYVRFSPKGTYLFSYHPQGVTAWGGPHFDRLKRFYHPNVRTSAVSPNEKYLVTFSSDPIKLDDNDEECPFTIKNEGHQICIWDIESGLLCATFPFIKSPYLHWPLIRWSYNDRYCARMVGDTLVVHDAEKKFAPLENKSLKVAGIRDFSFAPTSVKLQPFRANDEPSVLLSYWTPETNNISCKATIVEVPRGRVLKTVNLVQVSNVSLHWQNQSEYLCFNVERHTKSKKTLFSNLEIVKLTEKDLPVEKMELKEPVMAFEWEPKGSKFITISVADTDDDNVSVPKNIVSFFALEKKDSKDNDASIKWKLAKAISNKFSNTISWSPAGRFVVVASVVKPDVRRSELDFYDTEFNGEKNINDDKDVMASIKDVAHPANASVTDMTWDPSGRFLTCWSSSLKHKADNGFRMYNIAGHVIKEDGIKNFRNFMWRPRPESTLTNAERKKVRKNLKEWSAQFEEQDAMEENSAVRELILKQREQLKSWNAYRKSTDDRLQSKFNLQLSQLDGNKVVNENDYAVIEEIKEEIVEETQEKVEEQ
ncbi:hypothetical protein KAFR_0C05010 [Kazachstania africana CBS 2517]|uniref:Eukaryotic translation initiation factor 3 subunit B n=1 Tax=Kazachstania africana (strain ATCC 22294 / BCRC 22015 / CBS 2517 / CECT 1963 / NBRC 1671 / NRRL Y-8276) TaxID=1071382 RepID=H2ASZ2_KAZAF|nr:hypothetical protein KAFR_0C05010 [Kazachstania africana CBS 2517]CCF57492.1 hypothetical protein KAFR_0C05010 [Kazachstania africana CBS 2517]